MFPLSEFRLATMGYTRMDGHALKDLIAIVTRHPSRRGELRTTSHGPSSICGKT